jgi:hypothetical protein
MADFGAPVAAGIQPPNFTQSLSGLIGLQQQKQALQSGALGIQAQQAQLPAIQAESQIRQDKIAQSQEFARQYKALSPEDQHDPAKVIALQGQVAPLVPEIGKAVLEAHTAKVGLQSAATALDSQQRAALMGPIQSIAVNPGDPAAVDNASEAVKSWVSQHPEMAQAGGYAQSLLDKIKAADPKTWPHLANSLSSLLQPGSGVQTQPQGATVQNGQSTLVGTTAPAAAGGGFAPASSVQQQPAPSTSIIGPDGKPRLYGAQPPMQMGAAGPQASYAPGETEGAVGAVAPNIAHFQQVVADATAAPTRIGVLNNIKELAPQAMTGDATLKRQLISKLAGYVGWAGDATQTATDVMAKESALLASKGGNTDMARLLNEAATPNGHMTKEAIVKTADQLIGQEKAKQAAQGYFAGTAPNSPLYTQKLQLWNKYADPRAFEYANKSPDDRKAMLKSMGEADRSKLKADMLQLHNMGVEP